MKEGGPERIEISPKVTGLISGRARSRSKTSRCSASRSSPWVLLMVQSPEPSQLREPCLGFAPAEGALRGVQPHRELSPAPAFWLQQTLNYTLKPTVACLPLPAFSLRPDTMSNTGNLGGPRVSAFSITAIIQNIQIIIFSTKFSQESAVKWREKCLLR